MGKLGRKGSTGGGGKVNRTVAKKGPFLSFWSGFSSYAAQPSLTLFEFLLVQIRRSWVKRNSLALDEESRSWGTQGTEKPTDQ